MSLISGQKTRSVKSNTAHSAILSQQGSTKSGNYADKKAKALAAKNTVVMTYDELERIKGMCSQTNEHEDYKSMRQSERVTLHHQSLARVSQWPNTIHAERERKEYERIKKLEDDEVSYPFNKTNHQIDIPYFQINSILLRINKLSVINFILTFENCFDINFVDELD